MLVYIPHKTVLFVHTAVANVAETSTFISDNLVEVRGFPGQQFQLDLQTITNRILSFSLNTALPPGFNLYTNTDASESKCRCSVYEI